MKSGDVNAVCVEEWVFLGSFGQEIHRWFFFMFLFRNSVHSIPSVCHWHWCKYCQRTSEWCQFWHVFLECRAAAGSPKKLHAVLQETYWDGTAACSLLSQLFDGPSGMQNLRRIEQYPVDVRSQSWVVSHDNCPNRLGGAFREEWVGSRGFKAWTRVPQLGAGPVSKDQNGFNFENIQQ